MFLKITDLVQSVPRPDPPQNRHHIEHSSHGETQMEGSARHTCYLSEYTGHISVSSHRLLLYENLIAS